MAVKRNVKARQAEERAGAQRLRARRQASLMRGSQRKRSGAQAFSRVQQR